jgi:hypothetical protein
MTHLLGSYLMLFSRDNAVEPGTVADATGGATLEPCQAKTFPDSRPGANQRQRWDLLGSKGWTSRLTGSAGSTSLWAGA